MSKDDRTHKAQGARLAAARKAAGYKSAREAALDNLWPESTYRAHEGGSRTMGLDDADRYAQRFRGAGVQTSAQQILFGDDEAQAPAEDRHIIPVMGYIGAGAEIEPEFEQSPADGLEQVELPFAVPDDMIALQVRGDSMLPRYDDGDVVVVHRDQQRATGNLVGEEAAIRTYDGRRYLKRIMPGSRPHTFNLESFNARTIEGVRIVWASPIWIVVKASLARKVAKGARQKVVRLGTRKHLD